VGIESIILSQHPSGICLPKLLNQRVFHQATAGIGQAAEGVICFRSTV